MNYYKGYSVNTLYFARLINLYKYIEVEIAKFKEACVLGAFLAGIHRP